MPGPRDRSREAADGNGRGLRCRARHGAAIADAGLDATLSAGRYGRMFGSLDACDASEDALLALSQMLADPAGAASLGPNTAISAGFTYLAQFVDHDITFEPTSVLGRRNDLRTLANLRTPRLDLDSVYGGGPVVQPFLYDWCGTSCPGAKLLVDGPDGDLDLASRDLPRNSQGRALVPDPRNDEHVIIAQLHLLFIRFHNAVVDHLVGAGRTPEEELFGEARRLVTWHYQWIVTHQFLPLIVGRATAHDVLEPAPAGTAPVIRRRYYRPCGAGFIPVEFSAAAYRFGHSMVRNKYGVKRLPAAPPDPPRMSIFPGLTGFQRLPATLEIEWERFFVLPADVGQRDQKQNSMRIDISIAEPLRHLPDREDPLPLLNLRRGRALGLPSGQDVASAMNAPRLAGEDLQLGAIRGRTTRDALRHSTPLWYYVLCEAAKVGPGTAPTPDAPRGTFLGPVGGRIVAEVLVGLLECDQRSYLHESPSWQPELVTSGDFTMADLIAFTLDHERRLAPRRDQPV